jgi:protein-S-isoprenylcysteine O-methyltransferase Ste14
MMPRYRFSKPYADLVARLRVPCGFVLAAAFIWLSAPTRTSLLYGLPVAILGIWLRAWAAGHVAKDRRLATGGPYACVRNPLYLGTLLAAAGLVLAARSFPLALLFAAAFLLMYLPAIELEEQHLRSLFPEYAEYAARVPMLLPRFQRSPEGQRFAWRQWMHNREYQALAGFLAGAALLAGKALL